ncbi:hypothetical protein BKP45_15955 [Anaerobacillus alkalidiazotrophicus]|uniref:Methyltransferase domain-containing protein n=1 Tax=Anaerobacillus alkalidiazotrophicus TaxID=472963 RepID=A0A1S2M285_9BACI|nr:rRNA adenine N-6-methyltransferase family protein [Anaerobacillus alkalidiazotrophicus]OIJ18686.1 hypothetical protein BKP45_15955 [Anaerobacillus alkalidiazotrophicus]
MSRYLFLKSFLNSPGTIGSITPSSKKLAQKMISESSINCNSIVVELGAGTGVITEVILKNVSLIHPLIIFEKDEQLIDVLRNYNNTILYNDAFLLIDQLHTLQNKVDIIFNSLPLLNFSKSQIGDLLWQSYDLLKPGGKLIGFQYTPIHFGMIKEIFSETTIKFVPLNLPPAFIYVCQKV